MNDNVWKLLQIEPTTNQTLIKKAYASQSRIFHPEENPEEFMRLREAYNLAMNWAEKSADEEKSAQEQNRESVRDKEPEQTREPIRDEVPKQDRDLAPDEEIPHFVFRRDSGEPNPYRESEAYRAFLAVYKKENQKNWKLWTEYITSSDFLSVSQEEEFCALIEETVREKESEFRPGQEFIKSLYTAYCFTAISAGGYDGGELRQFRQEQNTYMVPEPILVIARAYPIPRKMTGNDYTMRAAFSNYYHLKALAEGIGWTDQSMRSLRLVLERYIPAYIKDNYTGNEMAEYARHPLGLRLLNYFFDTAQLIEECYQTAWETLGLKQAVMGRNKLLYGRLREICLEKCPELNEGEAAGFFDLNGAFTAYVEHEEGDPQQEEAAVKKFFEREDLKRALCNRRYVETRVLTCWIGFRRSPVFLRYLRTFYESDMTVPCARQVLQSIAQAEEDRRIFQQNTEDTAASASDEFISVNYRPFLRYWLNTAFRDFQDLGIYLQRQFPYSYEWAGRLFGTEEDREMVSVSRRISLNGTYLVNAHQGAQEDIEIEVRMHLYYVEYRMNGREMFRPFLSYEKIAALKAEELLLLLPMAVPAGDKSESYLYNVGISSENRELSEKLQRQLAETALPAENRTKVAEYLSKALMQRFFDMSQAKDDVLPLTIYQETRDTLYCAKWWQNERRMSVYVEQGQSGLMRHSSEVYDYIEEEQQAVALGKELLKQLIAPSSIDCSCMEKLPETVYVTEPAVPVRVLENEDITIDTLNGLLEQFAKGKLNRVEFSFAPNRWELKAEEVESYSRKRALVFLKQDKEYTCFYFDDTKYLFYAFYKKNNRIDVASNEYISLTHKNLPQQCIFDSFDSIQCNLKQILLMACNVEAFQKTGSVPLQSDCGWRNAWGGVFIQNRRVKYNLAKQELGKFPLERAYNSEKQPMLLDQDAETLNRHPLELEQRAQNGAVNITQIDGKRKTLFTEAMKRFFQGDLVWLRLSWDVSPDEYRKYFAPQYFEDILVRRMGKPMQCHIVLQRDEDRYTMLCLQDLAEKAEYCVADIRTYMNVESKYPKENFLGKTMPAYLIHKNPVPLRNQLDLLLDHMECLLPITRRFAEFAEEKPGKTRDYDAIKTEFLYFFSAIGYT